MKFIGRTRELAVLEKEYQRESSFVVMYGRRRVGKTTLIKQFIKNKNALYFLATMETERQNMNRLTAKTAEFTNQPYLSNAHFNNWQEVFSVFIKHKTDDKKILVIDEFQYLVQGNPAFPSIFQNVWDEILKDGNVMVILCGSHISMMTSSALDHSSPLYGRRTAQIRLQPMSFSEFSEAFTQLSFEERVKLYSVTGGVPKYFEFFDNEKTLFENIADNILSKSGFLYEEPLFLLGSEIREPVNYFSVLRAISMGNHKLSEISTVLEQKTTAITPYLSVLSQLFLIEKRVPVTEDKPEKSRKGLYYISDNFIEFWFKFIYPYRAELELDNISYAESKLNGNFIDNHVSFVYEQICREIFAERCKKGETDFHISKIGSFWDKDEQIDVVAVDNDRKRIFAGECKFYDKPVGAKVYYDLVNKCKRVKEFSGYEMIYGVFSKSGFDKKIVEIENNDNELILFNGF